MSNKIIGIDLGTTNSCVSVLEGGKPVVIVNNEGKRTTPSIVSFKNGEIKVGDPAKRQAVTNPKETLFSVKRFIGSKFSEVKEEASRMPYKVKKGTSDKVLIQANDKEYIPQEISAMVLQNLKKTAEDYLGETVSKAVITVPAYFNDSQRQATKEAGEIAGLEVLRIINEPTAAALAYGLDRKDKDHKVVVFDIGGGTHDVSILEIGSGVFEVLATSGDTHLGGDDFDERISSWITEEFKNQSGIDISQDAMALQRVREAAEKAKVELSSSIDVEINLPYLSAGSEGPKHFVSKLSRVKFENMIDDLVKRSLSPCATAMREAGLSNSDIDEVILVGGTSRIPKIQEEVEKFFGKKPSKSVNPDEVVSLGAAIQGGVLGGEVKDVLLLDVTPLSLGIETMGGVFTKLIDANTTIPTKKSQVFSTAVDNQPAVDIHVLQGERPMAADNRTLGRFQLTDIPPSMRGVPQIEVTFDIDSNGILNVTALDKGTGKKQNVRIESGSKLTEDEIERLRNEAKENEEEDKKRFQKSQAINNAENTCFQAEKTLKDLSDKISDDDKVKITDKIADLRKSKDSEDVSKIEQQSEELMKLLNDISANLYANPDSENQTSNSEGAESSTGNFEDVEFEEVTSDSK